MVTFFLFMYLVFLLVAAPAENQTEEMLNITTSYLNVKYIIILKNLTWYDALQECQLNNMQLVSITEQYQQAFLAAKAAQHNYPLWIGLSSKDVRFISLQPM